MGGQFGLELGGQFAPKLVVNLDWKLVVNLTVFSNSDIEKAFSILKQIQPKLAESMIFYKNSNQPDFGHVVKFPKEKHITAVWLDFKDLNQWMLKILFMKHKQVNHTFFIQQIDNYYRVGWKIKRSE